MIREREVKGIERGERDRERKSERDIKVLVKSPKLRNKALTKIDHKITTGLRDFSFFLSSTIVYELILIKISTKTKNIKNLYIFYFNAQSF